MSFESDVARVQVHLDRMAAATTFDEYAHEWTGFLYQLERLWERAFQFYKPAPWFQKVSPTYSKLRRKDSLLRYLKQARNAATHTLQGSLASSLNVAVREKYGRPFQLSQIKTSIEDGCLTIDLESRELLLDLDASVSRGAPSLARVLCRGKWYNPPKSHLGNQLPTQNPVVVGKIGLDFCLSFISELNRLAKRPIE